MMNENDFNGNIEESENRSNRLKSVKGLNSRDFSRKKFEEYSSPGAEANGSNIADMKETDGSGKQDQINNDFCEDQPEPEYDMQTADSEQTCDNTQTAGGDQACDDTRSESTENFYDDMKASDYHFSADKDEKTEEKVPMRANVFDWIKTFVISLITVIFFFTFIVCGVTVDGDSMNFTLINHDYLLISKLFYTPKTGDIVVLNTPNYDKPLIKRVIGTSGQKIEINFETWEVRVDGKLLQEDYVAKQYSPYMNPESVEVDENNCATIEVEENCVFVMGDNRNNSLDSRSNEIGQIDERYIMGKVLWRILPFDQFGKV